MKFCFRFILFTAILFNSALLSAIEEKQKDTLFQTSTIQALMKGVYDGDTACGALKQNGDFGIGTFNGLDGEMVFIDGVIYRVPDSGKPVIPKDSALSPFSVVTFFESDNTISSKKQMDYTKLEAFLDDHITQKNLIFAIRIDGTFKYIKTRSVPRQKKPYPPLVEVVKDQAYFEFYNVSGSIIGFRLPGYMKGLNVAGYHLHFITDNRSGGGHLLACKTQDIMVSIDTTDQFTLYLPQTPPFLAADLTQIDKKELMQVEQDR